MVSRTWKVWKDDKNTIQTRKRIRKWEKQNLTYTQAEKKKKRQKGIRNVSPTKTKDSATLWHLFKQHLKISFFCERFFCHKGEKGTGLHISHTLLFYFGFIVILEITVLSSERYIERDFPSIQKKKKKKKITNVLKSYYSDYYFLTSVVFSLKGNFNLAIEGSDLPKVCTKLLLHYHTYSINLWETRIASS